jgi:hypothetical protein
MSIGFADIKTVQKIMKNHFNKYYSLNKREKVILLLKFLPHSMYATADEWLKKIWYVYIYI